MCTSMFTIMQHIETDFFRVVLLLLLFILVFLKHDVLQAARIGVLDKNASCFLYVSIPVLCKNIETNISLNIF